MQCNTFEEMEEVVKKDTSIALLINPDRIHSIEKAITEVCNEKGWVV
jgi:hypothetical protein